MSLRLSANGDELRQRFYDLKTSHDVAELLEVDYRRLAYHLYIVSPSHKYTIFNVSKRSGNIRKISAPATALKIIQQKLNQVLQQVYEPKAAVHGFVQDRNIVTNARGHRRKRYVYNIDLKDFFPSINFGRVRGMFMAVPYERPPEVATVLSQICCFDNQLPQGAPTSPVVSNMLCAKMDSQLLRLAQRHRCYYTRYADDITFSTSMPRFPPALARVTPTGNTEVGDALAEVIRVNGFEINSMKVRLLTRYQRQEVTGLTVNEFPNVKRRFIRQIRAMLHALEKYGLAAAEAEFLLRYDSKHRHPDQEPPSFLQVVKGKIEFLGMVRGRDDTFYRCFTEKLKPLAPHLYNQKSEQEDPSVLVEYVDFQLHIARNGHVVASSTEGEASAEIPVEVPETVKALLGLIESDTVDADTLKLVGRTLYDWLFPYEIHTHLHQTEASARNSGSKVRIRLRVEAEKIARLPLELIYRKSGNHFIAVNPDTVLVRYLNLPLPPRPVRLQQTPLHMLVIVANPADQLDTQPAAWETMIREAMATPLASGAIELVTVKQATLKGIRDALRKQDPDIIQFVGHGAYQGRDGKGHLALVDDKTGNTKWIDDDTFVSLFRGHKDNLGLVSLATCESAKSENPQCFVGIAPKLVELGVPAVLAMQYSVRITTAQTFLEDFYASVAARKPIDWATQAARKAVAQEYGRGSREFATPVLYMRATDGNIF